MKAYLLITGTLFGLVGAAHLLRLFLEPHWSDGWFIVTNVALIAVCGALAVRAAVLLRRLRGTA